MPFISKLGFAMQSPKRTKNGNCPPLEGSTAGTSPFGSEALRLH